MISSFKKITIFLVASLFIMPLAHAGNFPYIKSWQNMAPQDRFVIKAASAGVAAGLYKAITTDSSVFEKMSSGGKATLVTTACVFAVPFVISALEAQIKNFKNILF